MTTNDVVDDETSTIWRDEEFVSSGHATPEPGALAAAGHGTAFLVRTLAVATVRATAVTALTATGCSLLVIGVGRPILRTAARLGADPATAPGDDASSRGAVVAALDATARSWGRFALAVTTFTLAAVVWSVPLSLLSVPVLVAIGIEPTARIASRDWEVRIETWGPAIVCAVVGGALLAVIPGALRRLVTLHRSPAPRAIGRSHLTGTSDR